MQINRHRLKPPLESSSGCEEKRNEKGMKRFWKISITPSFPSPSSWSLRCELIAQELLFNWPSICTAPWRLILAGQREEEGGKKGWQMGSVSLRYPVIRSDQPSPYSFPPSDVTGQTEDQPLPLSFRVNRGRYVLPPPQHSLYHPWEGNRGMKRSRKKNKMFEVIVFSIFFFCLGERVIVWEHILQRDSLSQRYRQLYREWSNGEKHCKSGTKDYFPQTPSL